MSAGTEQVGEKAKEAAGAEAGDKVADEKKAATDEAAAKKPKKAAIEGC